MAREIVYLEHDSNAIEFGLQDLGMGGNVSVIETEHEFRGHIDNLVLGKGLWPTLAVLDWRVPWTKPAVEMPPCPEEVKQDGYFENAGRRCFEYLRSADQAVGRVTPVLFYSVLREEDIFGKMAERGYVPQSGKFGYFSKEDIGRYDIWNWAINDLLRN